MSYVIHRHWKGPCYVTVGVATDADDEREHVLYRCLYDTEQPRTWSRPRASFDERLPSGERRFTPIARVRTLRRDEEPQVLAFGHDAWGAGRSLEDFVASYANDSNHLRGQRYVLESLEGELLANLNVLRLGDGAVGIASVATNPAHRRRGHARRLVRSVLELLRAQAGEAPAPRFFLFSEVPPAIYEACGFRVLGPEHQHFAPSVAMATGEEALSEAEARLLETYF
jgi:ribosomal protein S18 acetylase RimI-like enzyme